MRKLLQVARREYLAAVKTKGFIMGLVMAPLLMGGSIIAIAALRNQVDVSDKRVVIIDRTGALGEGLVKAAEERNQRDVNDAKTGRKLKPAYRFEVSAPRSDDPDAQRLELSDRVRRGELHAFLDIAPGVLQPGAAGGTNAPTVAYHAKNPALDDLRQWLQNPLNDLLRRVRMTAAGIDPSKVQDLFRWQAVEGMGLLSRDAATGQVQPPRRRGEAEAVGVPMAVMMLMWIVVMMGAMPLMNSVMEEKNQRIAEVLLGAVPSFDLMMGKVLGGLGVALTGAVVYVGMTLFSLANLGLAGYVPFPILVWFFAFMVLNIFMLGAVFAALGSLCSDAKDVQNATFPALLPTLVPMFIWLPVVQQPLSPFATWTSLFPPFTPMLMLLRQSASDAVPAWQPWAGLAGVLATTLLAVWVGGRVFRLGVLWPGKPPKFRELLRVILRG